MIAEKTSKNLSGIGILFAAHYVGLLCCIKLAYIMSLFLPWHFSRLCNISCQRLLLTAASNDVNNDVEWCGRCRRWNYRTL